MMKSHLLGLRSSKARYAIFALFFLGLMPTFHTVTAAPSAACGIIGSENQTISILLTCPGGADVTEVEYLSPLARHAIVVSTSTDGQEIFVELPSNAMAGIATGVSIARIKVSNADGTCTQTFLLKKDGGGMIIAIDEF